MARKPTAEIVDVSDTPFSHRDEDDGFLYHVTSADRASVILLDGLSPRAKHTVQGGAYQAYSKGKVFLTERAGVPYWTDRIENHLAHAHDNPPPVVVLRVPRGLVRDVQTDEVGERDSGHATFFTEHPVPTGRPPIAEPFIGYHGTRVAEEFTTFSVDGPPYDDAGEPLSSGSGPDVTAFMGAHFAKEESVARKFANGGVQWLKTRYDGEQPNPRVLRCALDIKRPATFESEEAFRDLAYRHSISDESTLEPALLKDGVEPDTDDAQAWYDDYDSDANRRLEVNRWLLEQRRPQEGEEDGLRTAAQELAAAAVAELKARGHDGTIYRNEVEGGTGLVIFDSDQATILSVDYINPRDKAVSRDESVADKLISGAATLQPPEPAPAKASRYTPEQADALDQMAARSQRLEAYACEVYGDRESAAPALSDPEERRNLAREMLEETFQIQVDAKGVVSFEELSAKARAIIGELPVRLYHHTATGVEERIREEGLRPQPGADVNCLGSGSGADRVFLTAESGGDAPDIYIGFAQRKHGGEPLTLSVVVRLDEIEPDQDDADIRSGRRQFTAARVPPGAIENFHAAPGKGNQPRPDKTPQEVEV